MDAISSEELYRTLTRTHPVYDAMMGEWDRYTDVTTAMCDKTKYLNRTIHEDPALYEFRMAISDFIPECPLAIRSIETTISNQAPRRDIPNDQAKLLEPFLGNADLMGNHLNNVNLDVLASLLTFGTLRVVISNFRPVNVQTRADEIEKGVQPYIAVYSPLDVLNWEMDRTGLLNWVLIRESYTTQDDILGSREKHERFIFYDRKTWKTWEFAIGGEQGSAIQLLGTPTVGEHNLGMVPMITEPLRGRGTRRMAGESFLKLSSRLDIRKFRYESDWNYDLYLHSHPTLVVKAIQELALTGIGSNAVLKLDPKANEDAKYLETPSAAFEALQKAIEEVRHGIYRQAGTDPLGVLEPGQNAFQASGIARAWSFTTTENRVLASIAEVMERVEMQEFELAMRYLTGKTPKIGERVFEGRISYPQRYDPSSVAALLDEIERLPRIVMSEGFHKWKQKQYVNRSAEDAEPSDIREWEAEIDKNPVLGITAGLGLASQTFQPPGFGKAVNDEFLDEDQIKKKKELDQKPKRGPGRKPPQSEE